MKKLKFAILLVAVTFLCGCGTDVSNEDVVKEYLELIEAGDKEEAREYYDDNILENEELKSSVETQVMERIEKAISDYRKDIITWDEVYKFAGQYSAAISSDKTVKLYETLGEIRSSKEAFAKAEEYFNNNYYEEALAQYKKVDSEDLNYSIAQNKKEECLNAIYDGAKAKWETKIENREWMEAIKIIDSYMSIFEGDKAEIANRVRSECVNGFLTDVTNQVNGYIENKKFEESFELIESIKNSYGENDKLDELKNNVLKKYEEYALECIQEYKKNHQITEGLLFIKAAQLYLPNSESLQKEFEELQKYTPTELADVYVFDGNTTFKRKTNYKDSYQNEYEYVLYCSKGTGEKNVEYLLNKKYVHFSTILAPSEEWEEEGKFVITIWGDGIKLYETSISRESYAKKIELDVTGIERLKIVLGKDDVSAFKYILLAEAYVYEKY